MIPKKYCFYKRGGDLMINKKFIVSTLLAGLTALSFPAGAFAQVSGTFVTGFVYNASSGNAPVPGAQVFVKCNSTTLPATTNGAGKYSVAFDVSDCNNGDVVNVTATKDDLQGSGSDTVDNVATNINIAVANVFVTAVPEFGGITSAMAVLASGGAFFAFRRRFAHATTK